LRNSKKVIAEKLTRPTHKRAMQLNIVAENSTICSSRSRRPFRKVLGISSCVCTHTHTHTHTHTLYAIF